MKTKKSIKIIALALAVGACAAFALAGCASAAADDEAVTNAPDLVSSATRNVGNNGESSAAADGSPLVNGEELFSQRDLEQTADLSEAVYLTLSDGEDILIREEGVYVLQGSASEVTVTVEAEDTAKVQLVLDGVSIVNSNFPCIYVKSADKVFLTTAADSSLSVTGSFVSDGETGTDAVIFSREDLSLNGTGTLRISSVKNGVSCKDDLKITGGSYIISAGSKCLEANDSIRIAGGSFTLTAGSDALHAENDDDDSLGYVYIGGGSFSISAQDDGIHGKAFVQIDGGSFTISAAEGIEATYVQLNGGTLDIQSWDDGINAARKSGAYPVYVEVNGGEISISMSAGDTDGIDSNGSIAVNGGTISITGNSSFDYDGSAVFNGGTILVNGQELSSIPNQMMGGPGGFGGGPGGFGGGQPGGQGGFGGGQPGGQGGPGRRG